MDAFVATRSVVANGHIQQGDNTMREGMDFGVGDVKSPPSSEATGRGKKKDAQMGLNVQQATLAHSSE